MKKVFHDKELGVIATRYNTQAKRIIARYNKDHIIITIPNGFNIKHLPEVIEEMRPQLRNFIEKQKENSGFVEDGMIIKTASISIRIEVSKLTKSLSYEIGKDTAIIYVSPSIDINTSENQRHILYLINNIIYKEAHKILIPRTIEFAKKHNLTVNNVKISKSRSRWGSCSNKKNINLSYYLMLLPQYLIDYVILHELAHTIEMNHSPAFWSLLDTLCGENATALSKIARRYNSTELELVRKY